MAKVKYNKLPKFIPCKPCWELKYCPYGPLVEFFPLFGPPDDAVFRQTTT